MRRKKLLMHFVAIVSLVVFITLGLASDGTTPPPASSGGGSGGCNRPCLSNERNALHCGRNSCAVTQAINAGNRDRTTVCNCN